MGRGWGGTGRDGATPSPSLSTPLSFSITVEAAGPINNARSRRGLLQRNSGAGDVPYPSQQGEHSLVFTLYPPAIRLLLIKESISQFPNQPAEAYDLSENVSRTNPGALPPHMLFLLLRGSSPLLAEDETEETEAPGRRGRLVIANCVLNSPLSSQVQHTGEPSSLKEEATAKRRGRNKKRRGGSRVGKQTAVVINLKTMTSPRASWPTLFNMLNANVGRTKAPLY